MYPRHLFVSYILFAHHLGVWLVDFPRVWPLLIVSSQCGLTCVPDFSSPCELLAAWIERQYQFPFDVFGGFGQDFIPAEVFLWC